MATGLGELRARFDAQPLHRMLGLTLDDARAGFARVVLATNPSTLSGVGGSVHGGVLAAMVDIAMLQALIASLEPDDIPNGTVDLNITYLRQAKGERIIAEATFLRKGRTIAVSEVEIRDRDGRLCAKGRTIYALKQRTG
jgi:uncharacterized protein (TIGR00369 family)